MVRLHLRCPSVDIYQRDENDTSASDYAGLESRTDLVDLFTTQSMLKREGHTCCSDEVCDGLQMAAAVGDLTMVKAFLLCTQVDLNVGYKYGRTPLFMAAMGNHTQVVEVLLGDPRTDVNVIVNSGNALCIASERGNRAIVELLLNHFDIDVNKINTRSRKTALILASEERHIEIIKMLLRHPQTFVNEVDTYDTTALEKASTRGYLDVVKLLLRCPKTEAVFDHSARSNDTARAIEMRDKLMQVRGVTIPLFCIRIRV